MSRLGKCKVDGCNGELTHVTYADWKNNCDGVACCKKCGIEHRLEYRFARSRYVTVMKDWQMLDSKSREQMKNE